MVNPSVTVHIHADATQALSEIKKVKSELESVEKGLTALRRRGRFRPPRFGR